MTDSSPAGEPRILVAICTYNEASNIDAMLTGITSALPQADVLVVDDNSPDGTADRVHQFATNPELRPSQVQCLVRQERGLGGAIAAAMQFAIDQSYDLFCNLDADLSHDPADLPRLVQAIQFDNRDGADVTVGSRYIAGGEIVGWPWHRRRMSGLINGFTRWALRLPVRDASGSFRCYRVSALRDLHFGDQSFEGYAFLQQVLMALHRQGKHFAEVPIRFTERVHGESKLDFSEAIRSAWTVVRLLRSSDAAR